MHLPCIAGATMVEPKAGATIVLGTYRWSYNTLFYNKVWFMFGFMSKLIVVVHTGSARSNQTEEQ